MIRVERYTHSPSWLNDGSALIIHAPGGEQIHAECLYSKPEGAAASSYGVRCVLRAVTASGDPITRRSGAQITYEATASGDKVADPEALVALADQLRRQAQHAAAEGLLQEIAVLRANAAVGIG